MAKAGPVLGMDVGGTKTLLAVARADGRIVAREEFATRAYGGPDDVVYLAERAAALAHGVRGGGGGDVAAVGCGFPEYVTPQSELSSCEVLTWSVQPGPALEAAFARRGLPCPQVAVDSDVRLGALGEARRGAGVGLASFVYLSVGTGLSCAFVPDAVAWAGQRGEAIAVGEWPASLVCDALAGGAGEDAAQAHGSLEAYASGAGIARRYWERCGMKLTTREISHSAAQGDSTARAVLTSAGVALGVAAGMLVAVLDPAAVVVGGGLGTGEPLLWSAAQTAYADASHRPAQPPLVRAQCGAQAGLWGALELARTG